MRLSGTVVTGFQQASKTFDLPTANIQIQDEYEHGVYAGLVFYSGAEYCAIVFIGKAWLLPGEPLQCEAHLFDFEGGDLYGQKIELKLLKLLRPAMKFTDEAQAAEVIASDLAAVKHFFAQEYVYGNHSS